MAPPVQVSALKRSALLGCEGSHAGWSTQRSCGLEHSAFVWPGALSAHAAWSTQRSRGLEHSELVWPGALSAHAAWSTQRSRGLEHSALMWPGALSICVAWSTQCSRCLEHSALTRPGGQLQCSGGTQGSRASVSPRGEEGVKMGPAVPLECVSPAKDGQIMVTSTTESEPRASGDGQERWSGCQAVPSLVSAAQRPWGARGGQ